MDINGNLWSPKQSAQREPKQTSPHVFYYNSRKFEPKKAPEQNFFAISFAALPRID
jgi:hypothetical protein